MCVFVCVLGVRGEANEKVAWKQRARSPMSIVDFTAVITTLPVVPVQRPRMMANEPETRSPKPANSND